MINAQSTQNVSVPVGMQTQLPKIKQKWDTRHIVIGCIAVFGAMLYFVVAGAVYQWGIISIYMTSYFKTIDPSLTSQNTAIAYPVMMICYGLTMRLGLYFSQKSHPLIVVPFCLFSLSASIFISSLMTSFWTFMVFFGVLFGLFYGATFMVVLYQMNKHFPGKKMYVNGVILSGMGCAPGIFGQFCYNFLNPLKIRPLVGYYIGNPEVEDIALKVPEVLKYLALFYLCFGFIGIVLMSPVLIKNRQRQNHHKQQQEKNHQQRIKNGLVDAQTPMQIVHFKIHPHEANSLKQALSSGIFWLEGLIVFLTACGAYFISGNYKTYVKKTINDDQFLTLIGAMSAVANGCSRMIWNLIFVKAGYKTMLLILLGLMIIILSTIRFTVNIPGLYFVLVVVSSCCIGGVMVSTPTAAQVIFGLHTGSNLYGFYWEIISIANLAEYLFVQNLSHNIGFDNVIYICLGMACAAVPLVMLTTFQGSWKNSTAQLEYCVQRQEAEIIKKYQQHKISKGQFLQLKLDFKRNKEIISEIAFEQSVQQLQIQYKKENENTLQPISHQNILKSQRDSPLQSLNIAFRMQIKLNGISKQNQARKEQTQEQKQKHEKQIQKYEKQKYQKKQKYEKQDQNIRSPTLLPVKERNRREVSIYSQKQYISPSKLLSSQQQQQQSPQK